MDAHYIQYVPILVILAIAAGLMGVVVILNSQIGPKGRKGFHEEAFECGSDPVGTPRQRFSVNFYLVAIFFIVFDIEAVFMYPWAVLFRQFLADPQFGLIALVEMFVFIGILFVGLIYVVRRGALKFT